MSDSRVPGFYKLSVEERRREVAARTEVTLDELVLAVDAGGIDPTTADKVVENVIGTYALPYGVALNVRINGVDRFVPMVVEEPSVIAAASNAAKMVRSGGGFVAEQDEALMIGQIQLYDVSDSSIASEEILRASEELLARATEAAPGLQPYGGGPRSLEVRDLGGGLLVVHVLVDCRDAMGANMVNTIAEAIAPRLAQLAKGKIGLRILSNLADRRRVRVTGRVDAGALPGRGVADPEASGAEIIDAIVQASRFAEADPYRAATHNKGIMNGVDAVVMATGNDWRAVEAGAHAYAARNGRYEPLAVWRRDGNQLVGTLELPLALGTVGGTLRVHPGARLALQMMGAQTARELAFAVASVGLASNLAALRALATEGIQRGHMTLHARSVAVTVGAREGEIEQVASSLVAGGTVTVEAAEKALARLRG
jgi:hydroxymethylglutaryl-CoA reductase